MLQVVRRHAVETQRPSGSVYLEGQVVLGARCDLARLYRPDSRSVGPGETGFTQSGNVVLGIYPKAFIGIASADRWPCLKGNICLSLNTGEFPAERGQKIEHVRREVRDHTTSGCSGELPLQGSLRIGASGVQICGPERKDAPEGAALNELRRADGRGEESPLEGHSKGSFELDREILKQGLRLGERRGKGFIAIHTLSLTEGAPDVCGVQVIGRADVYQIDCRVTPDSRSIGGSDRRTGQSFRCGGRFGT